MPEVLEAIGNNRAGRGADSPIVHWAGFVEEIAFAPAIAISSSTCGESPLTPTAPTTFELIKIGTPPCSGVASARASAATRPSRICSSNTRLGRR